MPVEILNVGQVSSPNWSSDGYPTVPANDLVASLLTNDAEANFGVNQSYTVNSMSLWFNDPAVFTPSSSISNVRLTIVARASLGGSQINPATLGVYFEIDDQFGTYISSQSFSTTVTGATVGPPLLRPGYYGSDYTTLTWDFPQTPYTPPGESPQPWDAAWFFPSTPFAGGPFIQIQSPQALTDGWPELTYLVLEVTFSSPGLIQCWVAPPSPPGCGVPPIELFEPFMLIDRGATQPLDITAQFAARFGQPPSGYSIWIIWRALDSSLWPNADSPIQGFLVP